MNCDWSDPREAVPTMIMVLDAMKEEISLDAAGRELIVSSLVGELDDFLSDVEVKLESRDNYLFGMGAFFDFERMIQFWRELKEMGAVLEVEPTSPY